MSSTSRSGASERRRCTHDSEWPESERAGSERLGGGVPAPDRPFRSSPLPSRLRDPAASPAGMRRRAERSERMALFAGSALPYFLALFAALYAAFGAQSPFLPTLLKEHGL